MSESISKTHEWRKIEEFEVGDFIHRWGDDLEVTAIEHTVPYVRLSYRDTDGSIKLNLYKLGGEYIARKREIVQEQEVPEGLYWIGEPGDDYGASGLVVLDIPEGKSDE